MNYMTTERVWCCVCNGTGKLRWLLLWKRDCHICGGEGKRPIIIDSRFPEDIKQQIRADAMFGANTYAALSGRGRSPINAVLNGLF